MDFTLECYFESTDDWGIISKHATFNEAYESRVNEIKQDNLCRQSFRYRIREDRVVYEDDVSTAFLVKENPSTVFDGWREDWF